MHTFFVKDIKDVKVASAHNHDVFGFFETGQTIFAYLWNTSGIEKARVLRHIQRESLSRIGKYL